MFDEDYKLELSQYIAECLRYRYTSRRSLALKIGVDKNTISDWLEGKLTQPLKLETLEKLADFRGERVEQTRAWLEGAEKRKKGILDQLPHEDPETVADVFALAFKLLQKYSHLTGMQGKVSSDFPTGIEESMCSPVGREILRELHSAVDRGDFDSLPEAFRRFVELCVFAYPEEQEAIVRGLIRGSVIMVGNGEVALIAKALRDMSGDSRYSADYLRRVQTGTPAPEWEQGCDVSRTVLPR